MNRNTDAPTRGELLLALAVFNKLTPENQEALLALAKAILRFQTASGDSEASAPRTR